MPWAKGPSAAKYHTPQHKAERKRWVEIIRRDGHTTCNEPVCVMPDRTIYHGQRWHLGHAPDGVTYIGPCHPLCNVRDGARRGRARQDTTTSRLNW